MSIEKNVIQLAGALVSCNLIGFRWSVIGREYSPQNRNIHLTCGVSCISMLRVLFYIYLLFPIKIYPTGRFNLNKESVCWNLIIQTDLGLSKEKCHIEWMYEEIKAYCFVDENSERHIWEDSMGVSVFRLYRSFLEEKLCITI